MKYTVLMKKDDQGWSVLVILCCVYSISFFGGRGQSLNRASEIICSPEMNRERYNVCQD